MTEAPNIFCDYLEHKEKTSKTPLLENQHGDQTKFL